jgi:hypothetical protein
MTTTTKVRGMIASPAVPAGLKIRRSTAPSWWQTFRCKHEFRQVSEEILGATVGLGFEITPLYRWHYECSSCGVKAVKEGILPLGWYKKLHPEFYPDGNFKKWPINPETGEKLPNAHKGEQP